MLEELSPETESLVEAGEFIAKQSHELPHSGKRGYDTIHRYRRILGVDNSPGEIPYERRSDPQRLAGLMRTIVDSECVRFYEIRDQKQTLIGLGSLALAQTVIHAEGQEKATNLDYYLELGQQDNEQLHCDIADELIRINSSLKNPKAKPTSRPAETVSTNGHSKKAICRERCLPAFATVPTQAKNPAIGFRLHPSTREINGAHIVDVVGVDRYDVSHQNAIVNVYTTNK